jgi:cytosine/adenosine deaminase-related metal-dependent hydrolase
VGRIVIRNGQVPPAGAGATVVIEGRRVVEVADRARRVDPLPGDWEIDADGRLVVPGLVDAHTNLAFGGLVRRAGMIGRPPPGVAGLRDLRDGLAARASPALLEPLARAGALAALRSGVTTVLDLVPGAPGEGGALLEAGARGLAAVGIRGVLAFAARGARGEPPRREDVRSSADFAAGRSGDRRVRGMVGLSGLVGVSDEVLDEARSRLAEGGLHASVGEDEADLAHVFSRSSRRPLDVLAAHGLLGPRSAIAHCGTVVHSDAVTLADSGATVVVTPRAAMCWGAPFPPVVALATLGVRVALGTDGLHPDVAGEAVAATLIVRAAERSTAAAEGLLGRVAWPAAARLASELFGDTLGALESGALADVVVVEWRPPVPLPDVHAGELAVLWAGAPAAWAIVDGEVRLREGRLLGGDERQIAEHASEAARTLLAG